MRTYCSFHVQLLPSWKYQYTLEIQLEARLAFCLRNVDSHFVMTLLRLRLRRLRHKCELDLMNEFDHCILALLKKQRERPEKFWPERGF